MPGLGELDLTKKPQKYELFLAKPNRTIIAKLKDAYGENIQLKLGSLNQLSFKLPYEVERNHQLVRNPHIDALRERYLIKAVNGSKSEWFIINSVSDDAADEGDSKSVEAMSLGYELSDKLIRLYTTEDSGPKTCTEALTDALSSTLWTVGTVAGAFDSIKRSFDVSSKTVLDFIIEIAETFKGILIWDTENRRISVVEQDNYGLDRGLRFSYGKYLKTISKKVTTDEMTTRLKVYGKDDLSIRRLNPTGMDYIESFAHFLYPFEQDTNGNVIQSSYYMSDDLCKAILAYDKLITDTENSTAPGSFKDLIAQKTAKEQEYSNQEIVVANREFEVDQVADTKDVQQANGTFNYLAGNFPVSGSSPDANKFTLKGLTTGRKHAVLFYMDDTTGITVNYKLGNGTDVVKTVSSATWTVLAKEDIVNDTTITITISGTPTNVPFKIETVEIKEYEYAGFVYDGATIKSDGATNSILTSADPETSWRNVKSGDKVYIENGTTTGYDETEMVGIVQSVDISDNQLHKITLDRQLAAGDYKLGYRITTTSNDSVIIENYVLEYNQTQLAEAQSALDEISLQIEQIDNNIMALRNTLAVENNFTPAQIQERNVFIIEKEWTDNNYVDDQSLYDDAKKKFDKLREPQTVINIDIVNFLEVVECQKDWDKLTLGDTVTIVYETFNTKSTAKIVEISFNYDSGEVNLTIANMKEIQTDKEKLIKLMYKSFSTSTTVDMNKFKWDKTVTDLGDIGAIINSKWDATTREITAGVNESVTINARGLTITDPNDPQRFLRATHGVLGITNDGGNSFKHAITADGIVGERIYGQIFMGNSLIIGDADGLFTLYGNNGIISDRSGNQVMKLGLYDTNGGDKFGIVLQKYDAVNTVTHKVVMDKDTGFKIQRNNAGTFEDIAWLDDQGRLTIKDLVATGSVTTSKLTVANLDINDLIYNATGGLRAFGNWIQDGMIEIGAISANKIKTDELIVGDNITMGVNATISWDNVTGTKPATDADNTMGAIGGTYLTNITSTGIYTGTLTGNTIQTGTSGARVVMNSTGLFGYGTDGVTKIFTLSGGNLSLTGNITMTGGSITWGANGVNAPNASQVGAESTITKSNIAPTNPTSGQLWLDTTSVPNILKRWSGTAWVNSSPTTAAQVGARPDTWMPTAADVGARPDTWVPSASQVGAVADTQTAIFNRLTNNGASSGLFIDSATSNLYINATYIMAGTLNLTNGVVIQTSANTAKLQIGSGGMTAWNSSGAVTFDINGSTGNATFTGTVTGSKIIFDTGGMYSGISWRISGVEKGYMDRDAAGGGLTISNDNSINLSSSNRVNLTGTNGVYAGSQRLDQPMVAVFG